MRYAMLQAIVMSEGPVKPGDSWKHTFPSGGGAVAGTGSYKFEGEEKVGGYACLKFTANYRETAGAAPASMTGTFWINSKDFTLVKFVGSMKNAPVPEVGPLDLKLWITRDGLK
jgi:hypothetical protein